MKILLFLTLSFTLTAASLIMTESPADAESGGDREISIIITEAISRNINKLPNKRVAVSDFTDIDGQEITEGKLLTEQIIANISQVKGIQIIERKQLNKILEEQELEMTGLTDSDESSIGKLLKADAIISGTITHLDNSEEINARMISIKTGEIYCAINHKIDLQDRKKEIAELPAGERNRINEEFSRRDLLKKNDPEFYSIVQKLKNEMRSLREKDSETFGNVLKTIKILERLRKNRGKIFILATEPEGSLRLQMVKNKKPQIFKRIMLFRERMQTVYRHAPSCKEKIKIERERIIKKLRER